MKKIGFIFIITAFAGSLWAGSMQETLRSLYDVVAPVISGNPAVADRQVGQVYYDVQAGAFKGINHNGGIDRLSNVASTTTSLPRLFVQGVNQTLGSPVSGYSILSFNDEPYDTGNNFNPSTGDYTVPATGAYSINVTITFAGSFSAGEILSVGILVDGQSVAGREVRVEAGTNFISANLVIDLPLNVGSVLQFGADVSLLTQPFIEIGGWANIKQIP